MPLEITTPSDREIVVSRHFDAPRDLVFECHTRPELVRRWLLGPPGTTMPVCEIDLRVGGRYRYVWRNPDGSDMGMGGTFTAVSRPAAYAARELFDEDWTGGETLVTTRFDETAGRTRVTTSILYSSAEARDGALKSGMAGGLEMGYARLDQLLATQSAA